MNRLNHWLYQKEKPLNITEEWRFDFNFDYDPPCLGLVVVLNESRMEELLETERKYKLLLEKMTDTLLYPMVVVTHQQSKT